MSKKQNILIQLDSDPHPSVFDAVVGVDSGVDHLLQYGHIEPVDVRELVHGAMFTRGGSSLRHTAIFIGGSKVNSAQQILRAVCDCFFGTVRVSVMLDANGANTTASAAVLCLQRHMSVDNKTIGILAATGSVGSRVAKVLAGEGACVRVASRSLNRAQKLCDEIASSTDSGNVESFETNNPIEFESFIDGCDAVISAGAANVQLLSENQWVSSGSLKVLIDLNAVPPAGIQGINAQDNGVQKGTSIVYGAIGVGNLKMKIHKQSIRSLFESNDQVLDIDQIFEIGKRLESELTA